jgi:hypothetical protein
MSIYPIVDILADLEDMGITRVALERTLELGIGFLKRVERYNDPETIALLKIIRAYPWILNVAEARFDRRASEYYLSKNMVDLFIDKKLWHSVGD